MASSSSSIYYEYDQNKRYQYDVFLSFSGENTRRTFVDHLFEGLQQHGIRTFKDDERLQKGKEIKGELLKSIDDSRFSVIVLSKKYASSSWCLDELVKIMECHKTTDQTAFPVFYDVEPTEVRKQSGSVGEAFAKHTKKVVVRKSLTRIVRKVSARNTSKKLRKWRKALKDVANLSGWELKNTIQGYEAKAIKLIVERVSLELRFINTCVDENLIGMEQRIKNLDPYLEIGSDDVRMIGIKGMGGAGKTTLARAIFDKISINFEGKCFVENVRENSKEPLLGLKKLQEQVLRDVLKDTCITISGVHEGTNLMKKMLCGKKVLVVLDDVNHKEQLEALAGEPKWFKAGSRIVITTRDEQVLIAHRVTLIQDVHLLSDEEAIRLFSKHAFREDMPTHEYEMQSLDQVLHYAAGLPLTIKVLGSFLCGKNKAEWIDALARLKTIPLEETLKKLELSFESLEDDYKEIFLDVACFCRRLTIDETIRMLEGCGFHARNGLRVLQQKSLITIDKRGNFIHLHDHIEEMGKNIIRREHPDEPHKHSRLWVKKEIAHVLANNLGSEATRCIRLDATHGIVLENLRKMKKLRYLRVQDDSNFDSLRIDEDPQCLPNSLQYLCWKYYPHWCLPKTFEAINLVTLEMSLSKIEQLWEGGKVMKKLKFLFLKNTKLKSLDLGLMPNLERLDLSSCRDLVKFNVHGQCLKTLVYLNLSNCKKLWRLDQHNDRYGFIKGFQQLPESLGHFERLEELNLSYTHVKHLPDGICMLKHLKKLVIQYCILLEKLPDKIGQLESLEGLFLSWGYSITQIPSSICTLKQLKILNLYHCLGLEKLPEDIGRLESLEELYLTRCQNITHIPISIRMLKHLKKLDLEDCVRLEKLPDELKDYILGIPE